VGAGTRASKSRLVLVLRLIGWESDANFFNQSEVTEKQNHGKHNITLNITLSEYVKNTGHLWPRESLTFFQYLSSRPRTQSYVSGGEGE